MSSSKWILAHCGFLSELELTFALQTLPHEAPQQGSTMVAEGGDLVVVDAELVGHVHTKAL